MPIALSSSFKTTLVKEELSNALSAITSTESGNVKLPVFDTGQRRSAVFSLLYKTPS